MVGQRYPLSLLQPFVPGGSPILPASSAEVDRVETLRDVQTWHAAATEILRAGWVSPESGGFIHQNIFLNVFSFFS